MCLYTDDTVLKSPLVSDLRLYDVVHTVGVATDLNHIDTPAPVKGYLPENDGLQKALSGAEVVLISAGKLYSYELVVIRH